ncbi:MAG TPA: DNA-3-methyladenine glycosylase 2 family protein [Bryobacteraceae bacterium]|nr:DNA-3-methyladenine glycosylase 2 family protein [Bryobacteraceae bacterium]
MRKAIIHLKKSDPVMRAIIERVGAYKIEHSEPTFSTLVRSIVNQQLSGRVAAVILGRLKTMLPDGAITPDAILKLTPARMRKAGLSKAKTLYIRELARKTKKGEVKFETLADLADIEVIEHLTQVKGIGVWTAHMFLIFALKRPDILATGDLGVRTAIRKAYELAELPAPKEIEALAIAWRPYSSVAMWYLWRSLEGPAQL